MAGDDVAERDLDERGLQRHAEEALAHPGDEDESIATTMYATVSAVSMFDPRTESHHHLVCTVCGSIEDLDSDLYTARLERAAANQGFEHERIEAVVHGRCASCRGAMA